MGLAAHHLAARVQYLVREGRGGVRGRNYFWMPPVWQSVQVSSGSSSPSGCLNSKPSPLSCMRSVPLPCARMVWQELQSLEEMTGLIVRVIDDWVTNRPLALIFEGRVGKGKILVSGIDLVQDSEKRPEAQQLLFSLKKYMAGSQFNPTVELSTNQLKKLYN